MLGMFFNPFGYNEIFKVVMDITGSYWTTAHVFYLCAGLFFGLYIFLAKINPFKWLIVPVKKIITKLNQLREDF
jgi:hypothetical protein